MQWATRNLGLKLTILKHWATQIPRVKFTIKFKFTIRVMFTIVKHWASRNLRFWPAIQKHWATHNLRLKVAFLMQWATHNPD